MRLPAGGDVGIQTPLLAGLNVVRAAVAGIGDQLLGKLAGVGHDPLKHGLEMGSITGLVDDPQRHDDLVVAIDRCLAVVALDLAVSTFEDVAVWIREIALGVAFWIVGGRGGEIAAGHRHRINAARRIRR